MTISPEWSRIAENFIGKADGRHCHWCRHIEHDDGASYCNNPDSKLSDGERIRSWDGAQCAAECPVFSLDPWYEDDANVEKYFDTKEGT
jgi:hypothetical protein